MTRSSARATPTMAPAAKAVPTIQRSIEDRIHETAMFAQVAQYLADDVLGDRNNHYVEGDFTKITTWQADLLLFAVHQAKFSAEATYDAYLAPEVAR